MFNYDCFFSKKYALLINSNNTLTIYYLTHSFDEENFKKSFNLRDYKSWAIRNGDQLRLELKIVGTSVCCWLEVTRILKYDRRLNDHHEEQFHFRKRNFHFFESHPSLPRVEFKRSNYDIRWKLYASTAIFSDLVYRNLSENYDSRKF